MTFNEINEIFKTLPVGYYCGRNVDRVLSKEADCSYYVPSEDRIVISYQQLTSVGVETMSETDIRCMLYHEVAHAMLTPTFLQISNIVNIFEDERIETLLANRFMKVDFKSFVKKINGDLINQNPRDAMEMFYQIVRFRKGPIEFTTRVKDLIAHSKILYYLYDIEARHKYKDIEYAIDHHTYRDKIQKLFDNVRDYFDEMSKASSFDAEKSNSEKNEETDNDLSTDDFDLSDKTKAETHNNVDASDLDIETDARTDDSLSNEQLCDALKQTINRCFDEDVEKSFASILNQNKKITKQNSSAINAYSGKFDPRSVIRDDYKWFAQANRSGHVKAYSKQHLTLFIDVSGSFKKNQNKANTILNALKRIEKQNQNFTFDVVACGQGQLILSKHERYIKCFGGNDLTPKIAEQIRQTQTTNAVNHNIVLFDGDAYTDCHTHPKNTFKFFDRKDTVIISDPDNQSYLARCKQAKVIITRDYVDELFKNVCYALQSLMR